MGLGPCHPIHSTISFLSSGLPAHLMAGPRVGEVVEPPPDKVRRRPRGFKDRRVLEEIPPMETDTKSPRMKKSNKEALKTKETVKEIVTEKVNSEKTESVNEWEVEVCLMKSNETTTYEKENSETKEPEAEEEEEEEDWVRRAQSVIARGKREDLRAIIRAGAARIKNIEALK